MMLKKLKLLVIAASLSLMVACASTPKFSSVAPGSKNISGLWVLDESLSQDVPRFSGRGAIRGSGGKGREQAKDRGKGQGGSRDSGRGRSDGGLQGQARGQDADNYQQQRSSPSLYVGKMKIEQDDTGMGIAFDNEPYQDIDWGVTEYDRSKVNAGWNSENQVVVIRETNRGSYIETFSINQAGDVLTQTVEMPKSKNQAIYTRVFNLDKEATKAQLID